MGLMIGWTCFWGEDGPNGGKEAIDTCLEVTKFEMMLAEEHFVIFGMFFNLSTPPLIREKN